MALTEKQKCILNFLKEGEKKKSEIVKRFKYWYYANSEKHIGDVLGRMVKSNKIIRIRKGVYSLNLHLKKNVNRNSDNAENQLSLF